MVKTIEPLFDEAAIAERVDALAEEIDQAIAGDFVVVGLLKGSFIFVASGGLVGTEKLRA